MNPKIGQNNFFTFNKKSSKRKKKKVSLGRAIKMSSLKGFYKKDSRTLVEIPSGHRLERKYERTQGSIM